MRPDAPGSRAPASPSVASPSKLCVRADRTDRPYSDPIPEDMLLAVFGKPSGPSVDPGRLNPRSGPCQTPPALPTDSPTPSEDETRSIRLGRYG